MAPALTEPLSPAEKLSKTTATATATTSPTTRSSKRQETAAAAAAAAAAVAVTPTSTASDATNTTTSPSISSENCENTTTAASGGTQKEKRNRHSTLATTSTRVTRSKDAYQRIFEQAVTSTAVATVTTVDTATTTTTATTATASIATTIAESKPKSNTKQNNEQMGVSPALTSNNNNNNNSNNNNINKDYSTPTDLQNTNSKESSAKDNSTAQLLADLTNDFEEAITAEICLRKQLLDVNLSKEAVGSTAAEVACATATAVADSTAAAQNILVNKITATTSAAVASQLHMESEPPLSSTPTPTPTAIPTATLITLDSTQSNNLLKPQNVTGKSAVAEQAIGQEKAQEKNKVVFNTAIATIESQRTQRPRDTTRPQIISVEELPPISTDSTMTASEVEDNLEERLSQLDGTAIISPSCDDIVAAVAADAAMGDVSATPPGTPTQQEALQYVQQQLQQTPPTSIGQQSLNAFTPHSATSSVNTLSSSNLPHTGEHMEDHDFEEVLKVLKTLDPTASGDPLGDLNSLFNEVYYTTLNYDEISSQPTTSSISKPNPLKEVHAEIEKKQQTMQRKIDFLIRRMRRVQARYMCKHTSEEISGLFEWSARTASSKGGGVHNHATDAGASFASSVISARPPALNWAEEKKNTVPAAQMCTMLRKLETVANAQQLCTAPTTSTTSLSNAYTNAQLKRSKKTAAIAHDAAHSSSSANVAVTSERKGDAAIVVVPTFDMNVAEEITHVAGLLQSEMREVQNAIDSDATESSSGGESADEMVSYNNQIQQPLSIAKRAAWRYSRDRAAIASRWSWLLSQIADLEIKIRQHSELFQEIVRTKGPVTSSYGHAAVAVANTTTAIQPQIASVNGYKGDISMTSTTVAAAEGSIKNNFEGEVGADVLDGSCRTRGFVPTVFRKRKLLQTTNIHTFSKKAARQSTIKCGCQWPLHPCALCTGRNDPTAPRDLPDTMMMADRVALLDSGYHPVLSFREDVSNSVHLEAIARLPEWQQRVMRCQVKSIAKSIWKAEREAAAAAGHVLAKKYGNAEQGTKRRYIKKKDRIMAEEKAAAAAAAAANAGSTGGASLNDSTAATGLGGNGIGTLSTSTTPLVANKLTKNSKKLHCHLVGDGVLLEPLSPATTNFNNSHSSSNHHQQQNTSSYIHQTSDYPPQNYDQFNLNQAHSSLISNHSSSKNSKNRKLSSTSATNVYYQHHYNNQHHLHHYSNNNQYYNTNGAGSSGIGSNEMNFLHTNDNWDCFATRSRTSSPTHGGSSNYHKYERSLDRKNRSSYDIDNIVIPYSVAAATRVEILNYKEIPTPKWRVIDGETSQGSSVAMDTIATTSETNFSNGFKSELENTAESSTTLTTATSAKTTTTTTAKTTAVPIKETKQSTTIITHAKESRNTNGEDAKMNNKDVINNDTGSFVEEKKNSNVLNEVNIITNSKVIKEQKPVEQSEEPIAKKSKVRKDSADDSAVTTDASLAATKTAVVRTLASNDDDAKRLENECDSSDGIDEDISDDTMMLRHERALTEERRKFQTYLKFPWSTRSRANRRIDSRAESSGANTPDPTSPAPNTPSLGGGDLESIPSPLAPSTPLNPLDSVSETSENPSASLSSVAGLAVNYINSKRYERRRTTSTKNNRELERRSSTPDPKELIPPYEPLKFPLTDDMFEMLLRTMPSDYHQNDSKYLEDCHNNASVKITRSSNNRYGLKNDTFVANTTSTIIKRTSLTANKSVANCDALLMHNNNRKTQQLQQQQKVNMNNMRNGNKATNIANAGANTEDDVESVGEVFKNKPRVVANVAQQQNNVNGQVIANGNSIDYNEDIADGDGDDDDDDIDEEMVEELDDDYPRHHLAPPNDDDDSAYDINHVTKERSFDEDDEYGAYVGRGGRRGLLGDSEADSSDTEPFQDDDPNDPEWKGETVERTEKTRKKF